jgi:integrase/recombinase XerD
MQSSVGAQVLAKPQNAYVRAVLRFAAFLGRAPGSASDEDLRRYQLHLVVQDISPIRTL